jgi:hypothetical protein
MVSFVISENRLEVDVLRAAEYVVVDLRILTAQVGDERFDLGALRGDILAAAVTTFTFFRFFRKNVRKAE